MLKAGFAQVDITPPPGTRKIGWLREIIGETTRDPLYARVAVLDGGDEAVAFIQLDTLSIRWTQVNDIRQRIAARCGFPGDHILVAATHTHAGPAVAHCGDVRRDEGYLEEMVARVVDAFATALASRQAATVGQGSTFEFGLSHNRRVVMRDGTTCTHGSFLDPNALFLEGPMDPEVAVLAVRGQQGNLLGALVNFACHPVHLGPDPCFSAGFPGVFAAAMQTAGCPVPLFLNGAAGNLHTSDPMHGTAGQPMEVVGETLARAALRVIETIPFSDQVTLGARSRTVALSYRQINEAEVTGTTRGAQRFVDPAIYERIIPGLLQRIRERGTQPAEVQALRVGDRAFVGIPAEYFVEHGLHIKEETHPAHTLVVGWANGMVGYVPHRDAFRRGGYETTFGPVSRLAPEAGVQLADCAISLVKELWAADPR